MSYVIVYALGAFTGPWLYRAAKAWWNKDPAKR